MNIAQSYTIPEPSRENKDIKTFLEIHYEKVEHNANCLLGT